MELTLILPRVYVGSCPVEPADIDQLKELGITAVFSLQTEEDFLFWGIDWPALESAYRKMDIELVRIPVQDFSPEDLREKLPACVAALEKLLQAGHTVFVHCSAGVNRS
ncbi:MAG TPA: dual specificity protein phosphatase family protein, partial [Thermoguttaceae bacterium]|nr:dual specificity protein phosphatase family protein [Thermoguttaceae bacterium]